jgi:hypothetical protein
VAWWQGEGNANDIIGGNGGALSNGVAFVTGTVNQAFSFNGTSSYVAVPDSASLRLTNTLTIEFWFKRAQVGGYNDYLLNKGGDWSKGGLNYGIGISPPVYGNLFQFFYAGGNRGCGNINDTNWHHCAVVAHNGDADPTFYLDGAVQTVTERQGAAKISLYPSTKPLIIGAQLDPIGTYYGKTLMDEVSLYNRALSSNEVAAIYKAGSFGKCPPIAPPVITAQPTNQTMTAGGTASFSVTATGSLPLTYQWSLNTVNLSGATNATLALTNVQSSQAGNYAVLVGNAGGSILSSNAVLTVVPNHFAWAQIP